MSQGQFATVALPPSAPSQPTLAPEGRSHRVGPFAYPSTWVLLALGFAFPFALMVLDPTLMFKRGWEQYLGTAIFLWAVVTLAVELVRLGRNERAFAEAARLLDNPHKISSQDHRLLPSRLRQLSAHAAGAVPVVQLMELNRESSALDQEDAHGRFTLTRYILYLLPVIGFIGTVEGISRALMNISKVLPMVKDLDGFLSNLTGVTSALQIAFDSTLLALFLSATLMLIQTLVIRRSDDLLARVDGWVVENLLPRLGSKGSGETLFTALAVSLDHLKNEIALQSQRTTEAVQDLAKRLDQGLAANVDRFSTAVDRLPLALADLERGTSAVGRLEPVLAKLAESASGALQASQTLSRIEELLAKAQQPDSSIEAIRRGVDRAGMDIDSLSNQWSTGRFEPVLAKLSESANGTAQSSQTLGRIEELLAKTQQPNPSIEAIRRGVDHAGSAIDSLSDHWSAAFEKNSRTTQDQLAKTLGSLKDALELLHVSMEQGNTLYRSIVKRIMTYPGHDDHSAAA